MDSGTRDTFALSTKLVLSSITEVSTKLNRVEVESGVKENDSSNQSMPFAFGARGVRVVSSKTLAPSSCTFIVDDGEAAAPIKKDREYRLPGVVRKSW